MAGADGRPFLARVRDLLAGRVRDSSLRQAAREVGVTPTGLQYFLDGGDPQDRTRRKLEGWYLWNEAGLELSGAEELEAIALAVLVRGLPPHERNAAVAGALGYFERAYRDAGIPVPGWISELREQVAADDDCRPVKDS
jgi:hypothetical protein